VLILDTHLLPRRDDHELMAAAWRASRQARQRRHVAAWRPPVRKMAHGGNQTHFVAASVAPMPARTMYGLASPMIGASIHSPAPL
jgi:hypothetical protein